MSASRTAILFPSRDGYELRGTAFEPAGEVRATVIICPAIFVRQRFYASLAAHLATAGFRTLTFDYRGCGESAHDVYGRPVNRLRYWGELDLHGVIAFASQSTPGRPIFALCHSMGGQLLGLAGNVSELAGIIAVTSSTAYWGHWPLRSRFILAGLWYALVPLATSLTSVVPGAALGLGQAVPAGPVRDWARWGRHAEYLLGDPKVRSHFAEFTGPLLAFSFTDDDFLAPRRAVEAMLARYSRARLEHRHLAPRDIGVKEIGHFGYFAERTGESLWKQTTEWIRARSSCGGENDETP